MRIAIIYEYESRNRNESKTNKLSNTKAKEEFDVSINNNNGQYVKKEKEIKKDEARALTYEQQDVEKRFIIKHKVNYKILTKINAMCSNNKITYKNALLNLETAILDLSIEYRKIDIIDFI